MPPPRNRGRGRGAAEGGRPQAAPTNGNGGGKPAADAGMRKGAGRGIPDYKAGPGGDADGSGDGSSGPAPKFNHQEAADWMSTRYQAVVDEYEKQKASGKKGDIQNFTDLNQERSAWSTSKPVIPPKDDFLFQLQQALGPHMRKTMSEDKGASS
mmetsp:Transcript_55281/g.131839  ORF Transcript_55281/g.131839 Transcript_55281/m.131839 type:complete len:154 (+) Transcript_55281:131-592(+)